MNSIKEFKYRSIGPFRGGRVVAVTGVASQPNVYYFGSTGGGIWKTTDGGSSWEPITDGQIKTGSVGAIAVAESDPNVIYAGMGEPDIRGNASPGDGVYKSNDAGKTWKHVGPGRHPADRRGSHSSRRIPTSSMWPRWAINSDPTSSAASIARMTAARPGNRSSRAGPRRARSIWLMDPSNPNVLYAALLGGLPDTLDVSKSGGPGSGLFKSTDGGDTWTDLTRAPGMPKGMVGTHRT